MLFVSINKQQEKKLEYNAKTTKDILLLVC